MFCQTCNLIMTLLLSDKCNENRIGRIIDMKALLCDCQNHTELKIHNVCLGKVKHDNYYSVSFYMICFFQFQNCRFHQSPTCLSSRRWWRLEPNRTPPNWISPTQRWSNWTPSPSTWFRRELASSSSIPSTWSLRRDSRPQ